MPELFSESIVQLILYFAIFAILTGIAIYVSGRIRANSLQQEQNDQKTEEQLKYFRDLNFEGKLSDEEFRNIKKQLSVQIVEAERSRRLGRNQPDFEELKIDRDALIAKARSQIEKQRNGLAEDSEDTRIIGKDEDNDGQDTVVG